MPLTANPALWAEGVALGRTVIWLHTYGERFADPETGRPAGAPMLPGERRPKVVVAIPAGTGHMPEGISYDSATETLHVGAGEIRPVLQRVWEYEVSGRASSRSGSTTESESPAGNGPRPATT